MLTENIIISIELLLYLYSYNKEIMTKENLFKKELADLLEKHGVELNVEVEHTFSRVDSVELLFDIRDKDGTYISTDNNFNIMNLIHTPITSNDIRKHLK